MDKTTAMTGTTAADRHDRRATAGSGHPGRRWPPRPDA